MKSTNFLAQLMVLTIFFMWVKPLNAQSSAVVTNTGIELIQFHSEHRCMTCNKIEEFSREAAKVHPKITFILVNVDDKKNEKMANQFEAAGTALFLYNPSTGQKKDLTDFAFMNARNKEKFVAGLNKEIDSFK